MAVIDPSTNLGRVRMRIGDFSDLPILSDEVIEQTLSDKNQNVNSASTICAQYILASLAFSGRKKMAQLEVYGSDVFSQYMKFLNLIVKDSSYNGVNPISLIVGKQCENPIIRFQKDFKNNFTQLNSDQVMDITANPLTDCCDIILDYVPTSEQP